MGPSFPHSPLTSSKLRDLCVDGLQGLGHLDPGFAGLKDFAQGPTRRRREAVKP